MAQTVHVEGVGDVDFPDNFSDKQITHAIETDILPNAKKTATPVETTGGGAATGVFPQMTGRRAVQDTERSANIPMALGESSLAGAASIPAALAEYVGYRKPAQMVREAKQHAADISYPAVSSLGSMIGEGATVGPVAGKAFQLAGKVPALGGSTLFKSGAGGLTAGALTPTEGKGEFSEEKPMQLASSTAMGAGLGKVGQMLTKPVVSDEIKKLMDMGMDRFTIGQLMGDMPIVGGALREGEKKMSSVPILGDIMASGVRNTFKGFNKAIANKALAPLGITVPENIKAGHETNQFINEQINKSYDDIANNNVFRTNLLDSTGKTTSGRIEEALNNYSPFIPDYASQLKKDVIKNIIEPMQKGQLIGGKDYRSMEKYLSSRANEAFEKGHEDLGFGYESILRSLRSEMAYQNPAVAKQIANTHEVFKNNKVLETASSRKGADEGVFSPDQFSSAVQQAAGRKQTASGLGKFSNEAKLAQNVMGGTVPNSNTADRAMWQKLAMGLGGAGATGVGSPALGALAIKSLIASGAYSPVGMKMLTNLATKRPEVFQKASPYVTGGLSALGGIQGAQPDLEPPIQTNP